LRILPFPANLIVALFFMILLLAKLPGEKPRTNKQDRDTIAPIN